MSRNLRFRYALEPVLLTRQWALDALTLDLAQQNGAIAALAAEQGRLTARIAAAGAAWEAATADGAAHSVDAFVLATRYQGDLARQGRDLATRMSELVERRDELVDQAVLARRGVEAAEQHRDEMKALFVRQRTSGDLKIADDQWNTLQSGVAVHGN